MSGDLIAFLRARLDEWETEAKDAAEQVGDANWEQRNANIVTVSDRDRYVAEDMAVETIWHVLYHDPARVLRQVEAMRAETRLHAPEPGQHPDFCGYDRHELPCPSLRNVAAIWSDHPDYRQKWAP